LPTDSTKKIADGSKGQKFVKFADVMDGSGAAGAARAPRLGKTTSAARRTRCRRRYLFC
jgi:hypothetical protein